MVRIFFTLLIVSLTACSGVRSGDLQQIDIGKTQYSPKVLLGERHRFPSTIRFIDLLTKESVLLAAEKSEDSLKLVGLTPFYSRGFLLEFKAGHYEFYPGALKLAVRPEILLQSVIVAFGSSVQDRRSLDKCTSLGEPGILICRGQGKGSSANLSFTIKGPDFHFQLTEISS